MDWDDIQQALQATVRSADAYLVSPWFYMQDGFGFGLQKDCRQCHQRRNPAVQS